MDICGKIHWESLMFLFSKQQTNFNWIRWNNWILLTGMRQTAFLFFKLYLYFYFSYFI